MKKTLFLILFFFIFFSFQKEVHPFITSKEAPLIESEKFIFSVGYSEYFRNNIGSVFEIPIVIQLGLSQKIEFIGIFPYMQIRNNKVRPIDTFGDILLFLKFHIAAFNFRYPFISKNPVKNQLDLIIGFNAATGPTKEQKEGIYFSPFATGLPDFRLGLLYSQSIKDLLVNFDFIYTFASQSGENYLPFGGSLWNNDNKTYLFGLVNVLVKFLWPGRYPWTPKEAKEWEKYPHIDDYFNFNIGLKYYLSPSWLYFSYEPFIEFNWLKSWDKWCIYPSSLLFTPGLQINLTDNISLTGGMSFIITKQVYQTIVTITKDPQTDANIITEKKADFYFDKLYFIGIKFLL